MLNEAYFRAKAKVLSAGYADEVSWQLSRQTKAIDETDLLRESAWVILSSGFRESIVKKIFTYISLCFYDWESAGVITQNRDMCRATALSAINHVGKIDGIIRVAEIIDKTGFNVLKQRIITDPICELMRFPYVGKITAYHLAKNLGFQVAKADRHLMRLSSIAGFSDVQEFCSTISEMTDDPINVVDIVLWRYATLEHNYKNKFITRKTN